MEMVGNSFQNFARAHKSFLHVTNMTLFENKFKVTLCSVKENNIKLYETKFHRNKIGRLIHINLNSKLLILNNNFTGNKIYKNAYHITTIYMTLICIKFRNKVPIKTLIFAELQSHVLILR